MGILEKQISEFTPSTDCLELIKHFEGMELKAYRDGGGVLTIGVGHTRGVTESMTCSYLQAMKWLEEDVEIACAAIPKLVKVPLQQHQFDALCSFVFNLGEGQFSRSTLLRKLNESDYRGADEQFPRWVYDNGKKFLGLQRRRDAERLLFLGYSWKNYQKEF